jgi:Phosphoesterase family
VKFAVGTLLIVSLATVFAYPQSNNLSHVQHVIVVIQENRTPDNLFQQDKTLINKGAHIVSQGSCGHGAFALQPVSLVTCWDTNHSHLSWTEMWANGAMTGACRIMLYTPHCTNQLPTCPDPNYASCPGMAYVQNTLWRSTPPQHILDPYFQIANQYGWANYMFQTNQGPSFPAHQFLFSGTSAPIQYNDPNDPCGTYPCWEWFSSENTGPVAGVTSGCIAVAGRTAAQIDPTSHRSLPPNPLGFSNGYPCYDHPALSDLLEAATPSVTWKFYARNPADLYTAPTAINHICQTNGAGNGGTCQGEDWQNNVGAVLPGMGKYKDDKAPILTDIANCNLPQVSWVTPDGNWSDHGGVQRGDGGPSWVAAIVNAIGQDTKCENGAGYWSDTTILITWDDWGGVYDDVAPPDCPGPGPCTGYGNRTGGQYVYGFRVPLLVVSAYAKHSYVSGPPSNPQCGGNNYCHDFGSILNFIEYAFGRGGQPLGAPFGIGPQQYPYADYFALDAPPNCTTCGYSLSDFFNFKQSVRKFIPITGAKYPPSCFHTPNAQGCFSTYPLDADNDAEETD